MGYPKEVYESAWETLNRRRTSYRDRLAARRDEIAAKLPEASMIERRMAATAAGITKAVVTQPDRADELIQRLGRENLALQKRRGELLEAAGYPADYLAEQHHCPHCRDTGYVGPEICPCLESLLRAEALAWLRSAAPLDSCTFEDFSLSYYPDSPVDSSQVVPRKRMGEVAEFCRKYAANFSRSSDSLLFLGQTGLGKTHLSLAIANEVTGRGFGVLYASAQQLLDRLEREKFSREKNADSQYSGNMEIVLNCDLLILDDLGAEFSTSFTNSALYNIVNTREAEHKPVIISTNLDLKAIEDRYSQRMASRLLCSYQVIKFFGRDIRFVRKTRS